MLGYVVISLGGINGDFVHIDKRTKLEKVEKWMVRWIRRRLYGST